ncbi:hypothetical protein JVU11DRAFT_11885 [Chiua virens]|nr:hypothetical protein JVU11DRAFT_11885 [Chiua virens]
MPLKDMATATNGFMFLRTLCGAVGLAIGQATLAAFLPQILATVTNIDRAGLGSNPGTLNDNTSRVHLIPVNQVFIQDQRRLSANTMLLFVTQCCMHGRGLSRWFG